jgi:hypothetical protein
MTVRTKFLAQGNRVDLAVDDAGRYLDTLPVVTYALEQDTLSGQLYLMTVAPFTVPSKLYGSTTADATRILRTFQDRARITGVLLSGDKGSGKTVLAQQISLLAAQQGLATILVGRMVPGQLLAPFLQALPTPAVVLFDEFEKVYGETSQQDTLLSLLDGTMGARALLVFTVNVLRDLTPYLLNRPGRIFYHLRFAGLTEAFVREYVADVLRDPTQIDAVVAVASRFPACSFDILKALCEEVNRYGEDPIEAVRYLNADLEQEDAHYLVAVTLPDGTTPAMVTTNYYHNPLTRPQVKVTYREGTGRHVTLMLHTQHLTHTGFGAQHLVYQTGDGTRVSFVTPKELERQQLPTPEPATARRPRRRLKPELAATRLATAEVAALTAAGEVELEF